MWLHRNELSREEKRQRALYLSLRDEIDYHLIENSLVEPYFEFLKQNIKYPYVNKRELKPRAKVIEKENSLMNGFIIIFSEDSLPADMKKNIRFFDTNKMTKENLGELQLTGLNSSDRFQKQQKYMESKRFYELLKSLLSVDYALLIQKDSSIKNKNRFALSHFHVRIDYLLDSAAESLGKELRYISKDLYEKGETYALAMVEKLFEYYSFHHTVSGRRTAAMLATQLLRQVDFYNTIYVSSTESRTLTKLHERGTSKFCLIRLSREEIKAIEEHPNGDPDFRKNFLIHDAARFGVAVMQVVYTLNENSKIPADGKLREIKQDVSWLRIRNQLLMPRFKEDSIRPIRYHNIYDQVDPLS